MSFNTCSNPSDLRITDMRFVDIDGAPKRCTILRIDTNQGISGFGEVRDFFAMTEPPFVGDYAIVRTSLGFHVMYFSGSEHSVVESRFSS